MMYQKVKDVAKTVLPKGDLLTAKTLSTMKLVSDIVGSTLGPGGSAVLIERQEFGMPSIVTKDGVTVFRSIALEDSVCQEIMAAARDAAIRTADSAGDGTTTATILAEAIVRLTNEYLKAHPDARPQRVVRELQAAFNDVIEPVLKAAARPVSLVKDRDLLHAVAKVSANGDVELADAVLECFDLVGDEGNVTLVEMSGPSGYKVEALKGYPLPIGYEESCSRFFPLFVNDTANQRVYMDRPKFLLYYGNVMDIQGLIPFFLKIASEWENGRHTPNIVLVATGFSEQALAGLAGNWPNTATINVYPCLVPRTPEQEGSLKILRDLSVLTGATLFDPLSRPLDLEYMDLSDLGHQMEYFEAQRTRSSIVGDADELALVDYIDALKVQAENAISILDKSYIEERIGKLTGGIARLTVVGSSSGELREKRDRAEDAVMAVRGAMKYGVLPAGGWGLMKAYTELHKGMATPVIKEILRPALMTPVKRLLSNVGFTEKESAGVISVIAENTRTDTPRIYDVYDGVWRDAYKEGLLDSLPAVLEAIRNSLSIASLLGTLGGTVVFKRDHELELAEARADAEWKRNASVTEATYNNEMNDRW